jgi:Protein of unknown function (DUF732)
MKRNRKVTVASLVLSAGLMGAAAAVAAPAQADPATDMFLSALEGEGLSGIDSTTAVSVGQSVCPMLVEPGQNLADVAGDVADKIGKPLGPATMFTGLAIQMFCPGAVAAVANGQSPLPLNLLGI